MCGCALLVSISCTVNCKCLCTFVVCMYGDTERVFKLVCVFVVCMYGDTERVFKLVCVVYINCRTSLLV